MSAELRDPARLHVGGAPCLARYRLAWCVAVGCSGSRLSLSFALGGVRVSAGVSVWALTEPRSLGLAWCPIIAAGAGVGGS